MLKDHTGKQFHGISATEFFLQTEGEVAREEMKEGSGTVGHMELRGGLQERKKTTCALSCYLHVSGWYLEKQGWPVEKPGLPFVW